MCDETEPGYRRGKIQEESLHYEHLKHTGGYPIIGVNTFRNPPCGPNARHAEARPLERGKKAEPTQAPARLSRAQNAASAEMLARLRRTAARQRQLACSVDGPVRACSLGQVTIALFEVWGAVPEECAVRAGCASRLSCLRLHHDVRLNIVDHEDGFRVSKLNVKHCLGYTDNLLYKTADVPRLS